MYQKVNVREAKDDFHMPMLGGGLGHLALMLLQEIASGYGVQLSAHIRFKRSFFPSSMVEIARDEREGWRIISRLLARPTICAI